jgi:broad specificity phosphatase PhoE
MTRIIFERHAQTFDNQASLISGREANPLLTEIGKIQADEAGEKIFSLYEHEIGLGVDSGKARTNETANIINRYLNTTRVSDDLLQEIDVGEFENYNKDFMKVLWVEPESINQCPLHHGESLLQFSARIIKSVCKYFFFPQETILLVSHGYAGLIVRGFLRNQIYAW